MRGSSLRLAAFRGATCMGAPLSVYARVTIPLRRILTLRPASRWDDRLRHTWKGGLRSAGERTGQRGGPHTGPPRRHRARLGGPGADRRQGGLLRSWRGQPSGTVRPGGHCRAPWRRGYDDEGRPGRRRWWSPIGRSAVLGRPYDRVGHRRGTRRSNSDLRIPVGRAENGPDTRDPSTSGRHDPHQRGVGGNEPLSPLEVGAVRRLSRHYVARGGRRRTAGPGRDRHGLVLPPRSLRPVRRASTGAASPR